jgi:hypothetical protein
MFENEIHNQGTPSQNLPEPQLFKNYELRSWNLSSRIYKIFGVSLLLNVVAIFVLGQSNLLTVKGCDSPLIGGVCDVLDTVYIGSKLFGTDSETIDADYTKTVIGPDDEITYIEVNEQPLYYPADYWEIANLNEPKDVGIPGIDGFPTGPIAPSNPAFPSMGGGLENRPQVLPTPNNDVVDENALPKPDEDDNASPATRGSGKRPPLGGRIGRKPPGGKVPVVPDSTPKPEPVVTPTPSTDVAVKCDPDINGICLNKRPLKDFAAAKLNDIKSNKVNLDAQVTIVMSAELGKGGIDKNTTVLVNPKVIEHRYDPAMQKMVQDGILAVGDSGWFGYLELFGVKKVLITVVQDGADFRASVTADQESENQAKTTAAGLQGLISLGAGNAKGDDLTFLKSASTSYEGNKFTVSFKISKQVAQELIKNKIQNEGAPTSSAQTRSEDQSAK